MCRKVIFDFDGVVCTSQDEMMKRLSEVGSRTYTVDDWTVYNYKENFGVDADKLCTIFGQDIYSGRLCKVNEYIEMCMRYAIYLGMEVCIYSLCADKETAKNKRRFIDKVELGDIPFVPLYGSDKHTQKADIIIDDSLDVLLCSNAAIKFVVDRPWNMDCSRCDIIRINNSEDGFKRFKGILDSMCNNEI